jgi:DNA-binding transcriptional LysR family regulator
MFRWDDLRYVIAVHRHRTHAAAGVSAGVDASTVSRRLAALERELGGKLFARTPDGLAPTDLALRLLPHAEAAETAAHAAAAEAAGAAVAAEGLVRVAVADAFAVYLLAPMLAAFYERHPRIRIDLLAGTAVADLTRREADIAVRFVRPTTGELVYKRVMTAGAYAGFVSRDYAARHPDLSRDAVDWINWSPTKAHLPEAVLYEQVVGRTPVFTADNLVVMIEAARHGVGALLLPVGWGALEEVVQLDDPAPVETEFPVYLVTHKALRRVPRVDVVWSWLESVLADLVRQT